MALAETKVTYGGFDLSFAGTQAAPFVSQENEYIQVGGATWVKLKLLTLTGTLTGCGQGALWALMQQVSGAFAEDFKTLSISGSQFSIPCCKLRSIDFDDSSMLSHVTYTVSLEAYDHDSFREAYKVIDPSERVEFTENDNKTMTKVISISAKGVSCGSGALANAKSFVENKFGEHVKGKPGLIPSQDSDYGAHLVSSAEEIDRITGTYTLTKTYLSDLGSATGELILRYTKEIFDERGEYRIVRFNGSVRYGIQNAAASASGHAKIKEFVSSNKLDGYRLINLNVNEDKFAGVINFTFEYTEDNIDVVDDWDVTISESSSSSLVQATINGIVTAKGPKECRWDKVIGYFKTNVEAIKRYYGITNGYYLTYNTPAKTAAGQDVKLNKKPLDFEISKDKKNGEISYSFNFDNRVSFGYYSFDYSMDFEPSIWKLSANPTVDGDWSILDLGYRGRARFNINGNFIGDGDPIKLGDFSKAKYKKYCTDSNKKEWHENEQETISKGGSTDSGGAFAHEWSFLPGAGVTKGPINPESGEYVIPLIKGVLMKGGQT
jgi:hypothetical protein